MTDKKNEKQNKKQEEKPAKGPSDFNDLHDVQGKSAVQTQLTQAAANDDPALPANDSAPELTTDQAESSPAPPVEVARPDVVELLRRYVLTVPDSRVWDRDKKRLMKSTAFKNIIGRRLFDAWLDHDQRGTVETEFVLLEMAAAQQGGPGGLAKALARFVYLSVTDTAWDDETKKVVPLSALRYQIADCFGDWVAHRHRREIPIDHLVFDPSMSVSADTHINMFTGIEMQPAEQSGAVGPILALVDHLCNGDEALANWLLDWIAYPLQNVGKKMASAVLMHSETQGSGKSLFFEEVVKAIYGRYGSTLGQHQLESQYTDWRSNLMFGLFEEVLSRDQKYSHTGTLKHMITGKTHRIEKKFVSGWEEANHMNAVFLSNEVQPFPLEKSDRRFLVIWPKTKLPDDKKLAVTLALDCGGVNEFYQLLLDRDLSGWYSHKEPPMTHAKARLIDFGLPSWETFYHDWEADCLPFPFATCLTADLFRVYCDWCTVRREHAVTHNKFSSFISTKDTVRRRRDIHYLDGYEKRKASIFQIGTPPEGKSQEVWIGECVANFQRFFENA